MMADQIKNENVGEVSSPTPEEKVEVNTPAAPEEQAENTAPATPEEKAEETPAETEEKAEETPAEDTPKAEPEKSEAAPKRKAPSFAEPNSKKASDKGDSKDEASKPERKLPTFKNEKDGENGGKPARKEPIIKPKERKFPVFANEVKQHQDDEDDDIDFTSDSITMPFAVPATAATVAVDASGVSASGGEKKKKNKKNKKGSAMPLTVVESDKEQAGNMDQLDELAQMGEAGIPFGAGYDAATRPYVPTYDKENAIIGAKQELANFAEPEPMPEYNPSDKGSSTSVKKDPWVDPGIAEANALLSDNRAERQRRKAAKNQPANTSSEPVNVAEAPVGDNAADNTPVPVSTKPVDPGIEEAAALLEAAAAEKQRLKALKAAKRNKNSEAPAVVVETAEANAPKAENAAPAETAAPAAVPAQAEDKAPAKAAPAAAPAEAANAQSSAPLTNAEAPKKVMLLLPENQSGMGVVAPKDVDVEAYSVDENKATPIPLAKVDVSDSYDKKKNKKAKNAELEALAVVYGAERAKQIASADKKSEKKAAHPDVEPYVAPVKASGAKESAPKAVSTSAYDAKKYAKDAKRAQREALAVVYGDEKARELASKDNKDGKSAKASAAAVVYGDAEPYNAPAKAAPAQAEPKAKKEFSPEAYANKQEKKLDKQEAKAEKKAEKEALLAVAAAEKQKEKEDKAAAKAETKKETPVVAPVYEDSNYNEGYDPSAFEKAPVAPDNSKAEKKAAKDEAKNESSAATHDNAKDKKNNRAAAAAALIAFYNGNKPVKKQAEKEEPAPVEETVYPDANYDEGYDPNWAANEQAAKDRENAANKEAKATERRDAKAAKDASRDAKNQHRYETHEEKVIREREERDELLLTYKEEIAREKAAKAAAKAAISKTAPKNETAEVVYADYTETFDKDAYEAEKRSEADAKAQAAAESGARKAEKRLAKEAIAEEKILSDYDKATGREVANIEMAAEMIALDKQYTKEEKERRERARAADKAIAKANKSVSTSSDEIEYPDYEEQFDETLYNTDIENAKEARAADELARRDAKALKRNANRSEYENKILAAYDKATGAVIAAAEEEAEMLALDKQYTKEQKERAAMARAAEKAANKSNKALKETNEIIYSDYEEQFDSELYLSELESAKEANAADELAKREAKLAKHNARLNNRDAKAIAAYDKATGAAIAAKEEEAEMLALNKQYTKEQKERTERARAAEKAIAKAERTLEPIYESIYPDITETFDEIQYANELQAKADVVIARDLKKHEAKIEKDIARKNARENKLISNYDKALGNHINTEAQEKEMVALARQDEKETKARAKKYKKLLEADMIAAVKADESGSHGVVYPDPEYLPDEFDDKFLELTAANPGDVIEGKIPRITSVREIRRAEREDKELALLVNKEKRRLKKIRYDIETLDIADKYVEDGSLEMADTRTVLKDAKRAEREEKDRRAVKEYEKNLENEEMVYFAEDYDLRLKRNKKRLKRAKKYGKFMLEYGSTYDPEWDGDFNNYGLPEVHPYTEGVKLSRSRRRTPKKERLSYFDKKKLSELSRNQCKLDNKMIEARVQSEYTELMLEVARVEQEFSGEYRTRKEKHWLRDSRAKLKNLKMKIATALKYEKLDNERYYSVVATDFERVELPQKADREELVAMREELMRLLDIRDEINTQLLELYTGTENGMRGSTKGRAKATLRARKWAHAKLIRYFRVLNKHRVTRNEKMRIFDKMDEVVDLKGQLARANYILRKERPVGKVRREYLKEKKIAKRDIRILKKSIERATIRALIKARKREKQERAMVIAYSIFALIALFVVSMIFMGPTIIQATKLLVPENFHKYLDIILKYWPL